MKTSISKPKTVNKKEKAEIREKRTKRKTQQQICHNFRKNNSKFQEEERRRAFCLSDVVETFSNLFPFVNPRHDQHAPKKTQIYRLSIPMNHIASHLQKKEIHNFTISRYDCAKCFVINISLHFALFIRETTSSRSLFSILLYLIFT